MYKPSYISGYRFGTGIPSSSISRSFKIVEYIHLNVFAQILEGTFLATSQKNYSIKHYKKHIDFE